MFLLSFVAVVEKFCMGLHSFLLKFIWYQIKVKHFFMEILVTYYKAKYAQTTYDDKDSICIL